LLRKTQGSCPKDGGVKYTNKNPFLSFYSHPEEVLIPSVTSAERNSTITGLMAISTPFDLIYTVRTRVF
jgi:hypothetical protein